MKKKNVGFYLFNKNNYLKLKEGLGKKIYNECLKGSGEEDEEMKKTLLSQLVAEPRASKRFNNNLNVRSTIKRNNGGKNSLMASLRTKIKGKEKVYNDNLKARGDGNSYSLYSDGLKFFSDLGGYDDEDDDDDFFGYNKSNYYNNPFSNFGYGGYNYGYSGYGYNNYGYNYGYNYNNNYYPKKKEQQNKYVYDPVKYKAAQENWKEFSEGIKSLNGVYLLQTIGSVIKALRAIEEDDNGKNRISLSERIKLYKLLEANEAIINFLTQERPQKEEEEIEPDEEEDVLVPDEHPEDFTSLEELEEKIKLLKVQLEKKILNLMIEKNWKNYIIYICNKKIY